MRGLAEMEVLDAPAIEDETRYLTGLISLEMHVAIQSLDCLLYTSDAADE